MHLLLFSIPSNAFLIFFSLHLYTVHVLHVQYMYSIVRPSYIAPGPMPSGLITIGHWDHFTLIQ